MVEFLGQLRNDDGEPQAPPPEEQDGDPQPARPLPDSAAHEVNEGVQPAVP